MLKGSKVRVRVSKPEVSPPKSFEVTITGDGICKGCDGFMLWARTANGKAMPLNPRPEGDLFISHWATCEAADSFRNQEDPE